MKKITFQTNPIYVEENEQDKKRLFIACGNELREIPYFLFWFVPLMSSIVSVLLLVLLIILVGGLVYG